MHVRAMQGPFGVIGKAWRGLDRRSLTLLREIIELPSGGSKRVFDRHLNMFVPLVVRRRMIDYDGFVPWNGKRDVDMEAGAVITTTVIVSYKTRQIRRSRPAKTTE